MIAKAAVDLDRANRHHEALQYYMDASQMLIELARTEKDDLRRNAYVRDLEIRYKCQFYSHHLRDLLYFIYSHHLRVFELPTYILKNSVTESQMNTHTHTHTRFPQIQRTRGELFEQGGGDQET